MKYVVSKLTGAQDYNFYVPGTGQGVNLISCTIHINGGANLADKHFITADGVITELTDEQAERLKTHPVFAIHEKNGFVKIVDTEKTADKAKKDLEDEDKSAPLTPKKYANEGKRAPKTKGA
ncbi:MAG: hypothetical protein J6R32_06265 [Bacteroidales bacterium]|nr:hypothetical protein [Bacteroidales bacterium]